MLVSSERLGQDAIRNGALPRWSTNQVDQSTTSSDHVNQAPKDVLRRSFLVADLFNVELRRARFGPISSALLAGGGSAKRSRPVPRPWLSLDFQVLHVSSGLQVAIDKLDSTMPRANHPKERRLTNIEPTAELLQLASPLLVVRHHAARYVNKLCFKYLD